MATWSTRRLASTLGVGLLLLAAAAGALFKYRHLFHAQSPWSPTTEQWQAEALQQSRRSEQLDGATVFFGDSLMVGFATSRLPGGTENFGIDGDSIDGLLLRAPRYDLGGARLIVLEIGINNWPMDHFAGFGDKYRRLLALLPNGVPIVALAIMPVNDRIARYYTIAGLQSGIHAANRAIAGACGRVPRCRYLDLSRALSDRTGRLLPEYEVGDGLHLASKGYAIWQRALAPLISREMSLTRREPQAGGARPL